MQKKNIHTTHRKFGLCFECDVYLNEPNNDCKGERRKKSQISSITQHRNWEVLARAQSSHFIANLWCKYATYAHFDRNNGKIEISMLHVMSNSIGQREFSRSICGACVSIVAVQFVHETSPLRL